jgi:hypothetical protein
MPLLATRPPQTTANPVAAAVASRRPDMRARGRPAAVGICIRARLPLRHRRLRPSPTIAPLAVTVTETETESAIAIAIPTRRGTHRETHREIRTEILRGTRATEMLTDAHETIPLLRRSHVSDVTGPPAASRLQSPGALPRGPTRRPRTTTAATGTLARLVGPVGHQRRRRRLRSRHALAAP